MSHPTAVSPLPPLPLVAGHPRFLAEHPSRKHPVYIVQGAQWGSEGKGQIAALLAQHYGCGAVVRTGSINAGHTVHYKGREYKMQLLPTAWVAPDVKLVLGPGCFVHRALLAKECKMIRDATGEDIRNRLFIDHRCSVHSEAAEARGQSSPRHVSMGATGKGSSDAFVERLMARGDICSAENNLFRTDPSAGEIDFSNCIFDTAVFLREVLDFAPVLLEGTQGAHLDLFTGPWPYTSNRPVSTAAWLAYAGLPPTLDIRPILVARTYPIRVAGNSGPMPLEWTWPELYRYMWDVAGSGRRKMPIVTEDSLARFELELRTALHAMGCPLGHDIDQWAATARVEWRRALSEAPTTALLACPAANRLALSSFIEKTTVTNKIRRVARWHLPTVREAINLNGCFGMWISFLNYRFPDVWGDTNLLSGRALDWVEQQARLLGVPILGVTTERQPENHIHLPQ